MGVCGHSAGAFNACMVAREIPDIACAGLLGALYGSVEELVEWNWGRVRDAWPRLSEAQRDWLREHRPREVVGAFRTRDFVDAARRGERTVTLEAEGVRLEIDLVRFRQDMERPVADEFRHVRCPALVLHGGDDMNVHVEDALGTFQALRSAGNEQVELVILPGVDHSFQPLEGTRCSGSGIGSRSPRWRVRFSPIGAVTSWAARVLRVYQ